MRRNGQNSTSGEMFNPKFEIPMGYFLFQYEFWWGFRQDLYVFWAKNGFYNVDVSWTGWPLHGLPRPYSGAATLSEFDYGLRSFW